MSVHMEIMNQNSHTPHSNQTNSICKRNCDRLMFMRPKGKGRKQEPKCQHSPHHTQKQKTTHTHISI